MKSEDSYSNCSDEELMIFASEEKLDAFEALVRRHQTSVVNFFRRMGVYNDAEDLAQETFVRLFQARKRYQITAKFTTFLYVIARRICLDYFRHQKRETDGMERLTQYLCVEEEHNVPNEMAGRALEALEKLPEKMKMVVILNIYQGLKYEEIAEVMKIPVGTVKSRMFNALRKIREEIEER